MVVDGWVWSDSTRGRRTTGRAGGVAQLEEAAESAVEAASPGVHGEQSRPVGSVNGDAAHKAARSRRPVCDVGAGVGSGDRSPTRTRATSSTGLATERGGQQTRSVMTRLLAWLRLTLRPPMSSSRARSVSCTLPRVSARAAATAAACSVRGGRGSRRATSFLADQREVGPMASSSAEDRQPAIPSGAGRTRSGGTRTARRGVRPRLGSSAAPARRAAAATACPPREAMVGARRRSTSARAPG